MSKRYKTPHRDRIIKTRVTEEEHADFMERLTAYGMSQSEFIRQVITGATVKPIITVSPVNDELLAAVGRLTSAATSIRLPDAITPTYRLSPWSSGGCQCLSPTTRR